MIIQAYIRVLADGATISTLHRETNVSSATVKELKSGRGLSEGDKWWNWETTRTPIDVNNPDDGIKALLRSYQPIFPIIKKYKRPDTDVYLEVVTHYEEGEEPPGLYLSAETILLLGELGGALDNDVVALVKENRSD